MFITAMASFAFANLNPTNYLGGVSFRPERDIPDLSGKVVLVTGGNAGLGKETIRQLLQHDPAHIFLAARSEQKAKAALDELKASAPDGNTTLTWLPLDLSSTTSVRDAAATFKAQSHRLDILILNAGVMSLPPGETDLGHEIQLGTNHTGHFLLTTLLLSTLLRTAEEEPDSDVRVVSLSSIGHNLAPTFDTILDQEKLKRCNTHARYGASKVANILFAAELARRYPSITSVSVHPGLIATDLYGPIGKRNPVAALGSRVLGAVGTQVDAGARNQLWAAAGATKDELVNGAYYVPVGIRKGFNPYVRSEEMGRELWEWSEREVRRGTRSPRL
ncbi:Putative Dehydrogenase with different specificitie [Aspergillus calidoustus]|uniref:Putative Dehydrogenase with different specificitie n=1 Tax=Aspergillus calidoustus TaxID=454130 RepID=A0A0U5CJZ4_ASPCI|nr:Putative Dehydrogenase with different specificitie [Aspergillus calidoustus]